MNQEDIINIVHKTISGFMSNEEHFTETDKLLLSVNKAICNAIKEHYENYTCPYPNRNL